MSAMPQDSASQFALIATTAQPQTSVVVDNTRENTDASSFSTVMADQKPKSKAVDVSLQQPQDADKLQQQPSLNTLQQVHSITITGNVLQAKGKELPPFVGGLPLDTFIGDERLVGSDPLMGLLFQELPMESNAETASETLTLPAQLSELGDDKQDWNILMAGPLTETPVQPHSSTIIQITSPAHQPVYPLGQPNLTKTPSFITVTAADQQALMPEVHLDDWQQPLKDTSLSIQAGEAKLLTSVDPIAAEKLIAAMAAKDELIASNLPESLPLGLVGESLKSGSHELAPSALDALQGSSGVSKSPLIQTGVATPVGSPTWSETVMQRVMWMSSQNLQQAEIQLDPPELGSLQVRISVQGDQTTVSFISPQGVVRDALDQHLPRLRELMSEQGVNLVDVDVSEQGANQHSQQNNVTEQENNGQQVVDQEEELAEQDQGQLASETISGQQALGIIDDFA
mgnify:CR=1 FL=1